jgi:predicted short-subunit dehydrogenase-like oxidoreductase (DUF2520 family)
MTMRKPTVSIIGPGRLGVALGIALHSVGYQIVSLVGRREKELRKAAKVLDVPLETLVAKDLEKYRPADLVIVAVPDDRIADVARSLTNVDSRQRPTILHTSGALSSSVFSDLAKKGWRTGSLHPLASISEPVAGAELLKKAFWCIEGESYASRLARRVVKDLGGQSFSIDSKDKPLYHAAAVMTSGNVTAVFDVALQMLERCGLTRSKAQKVLLPLLQSNTTNLVHSSPAEALTGTFARGDLATMELHLSALNKKGMQEALTLYRILGEHSLELAENRISSDVLNAIKKRLKSRP